MSSHSDHTPDPGAIVRMPPMSVPPPRPRVVLVAMFAIAVLVALAIGIGIGRATLEDPAAAPTAPLTTPERGRLKVVSIPADGNVVLDGRFVGVAPLENLDLDPGKHSIVIDLFGYQPYSGTVDIEARGRAKLSVVLAPVGATDTTVGNVSGGGTATRVTVPPSALLPPQRRHADRSETSRAQARPAAHSGLRPAATATRLQRREPHLSRGL